MNVCFYTAIDRLALGTVAAIEFLPVIALAAIGGIDGLAAAMVIAAVVVTPMGGWEAVGVAADPVALLAGIGVGIASSVIPYVCDQLALARLRRATYALLVSLLPATATAIGIAVLAQIPTIAETAGLILVIAGVALHREPRGPSDPATPLTPPTDPSATPPAAIPRPAGSTAPAAASR